MDAYFKSDLYTSSFDGPLRYIHGIPGMVPFYSKIKFKPGSTIQRHSDESSDVWWREVEDADIPVRLLQYKDKKFQLIRTRVWRWKLVKAALAVKKSTAMLDAEKSKARQEEARANGKLVKLTNWKIRNIS